MGNGTGVDEPGGRWETVSGQGEQTEVGEERKELMHGGCYRGGALDAVCAAADEKQYQVAIGKAEVTANTGSGIG